MERFLSGLTRTITSNRFLAWVIVICSILLVGKFVTLIINAVEAITLLLYLTFHTI